MGARRAYAVHSDSVSVPTTREENSGTKETESDRDSQMLKSDMQLEIPDKKSKNYKGMRENNKKSNGEEKHESVGIRDVVKLFDKTDVSILVAGVFLAILGGMTPALTVFVFGQVVDDFITAVRNNYNNSTNGTNPFDDLIDVATTRAIYFCILGVLTYLISMVQGSLWCFQAERQIRKLRKMLFDSILRQDIAWFEQQNKGELSSRFSEDILKIKEVFGIKVGMFIRWFVIWLACAVMALSLNWKLALVALAFSPMLVLTEAFCIKLLRTISKTESESYSKAGAVAEEAIRSIRTVTAFDGQQKELNRYSEMLRIVEKTVLQKGIVLGVSFSLYWTSIYLLMALCFWYGVKLFQEEGYTLGDIFYVFFGVFFGSSTFGDAIPLLEEFSIAHTAAAKIYKIIYFEPTINKSLEKGEIPSTLTGTLSFDDIAFSYPSRPDVSVLHGTSFVIPNGKTVALVGTSGSGKSTVVQLLQRFYDPDNGTIYCDGIDIRTLNLKWYRDQLAVVSQEPVLFPSTIGENIRYGREGVTRSEIEAAAREANVHAFIESLPDKYDTIIGDRGQRLSGGQKQRIAIARALVKNPKFLLLDEATSALDNENELLVQKALDSAQKDRTTLVIAHRLSTIRNADQIIVMEDGRIMESGSHKELMMKEDYYYRMVTQQINDEDDVLTKMDKDRIEIDEDVITTNDMLQSAFSNSILLEDLNKKEAKNKENVSEKAASMKRIIALNSAEWPFIVLGCIACFFTGSLLVGIAIVLGEYLQVLVIQDFEEQSEQSQLITTIILGLAVLMFSTYLVKILSFVVAGSRLTLSLRKMGFKSIMRQDISFFDDPQNQVGHLTTHLSSDATQVQGASGSKLGSILENIVTAVGTLVASFYYSWKLTLVVLAFYPLSVLCGVFMAAVNKGGSHTDEKIIAEAGYIYSQVIDSITTVTSLNAQSQFKAKYDSLVDQLYRKGKKYGFIQGVVLAFQAAFLNFTYAAAFVYGANLVQDGEIEFQNVFRVFILIVFGGLVIGKESTNTLDFSKARLAAQRILKLVDRVPDIDSYSESGIIPSKCTGEVDVENLQFSYPARPEVVVLKNISLSLKAGETVALVGQSGCGKSTMVQLLERFYDSRRGAISLDKKDIKSLNISWLRSQIGIVSQEPTLFNCSIAENIAYGDNKRTVSLTEIIESARLANIHNFITSLPQGYDTNVGAGGAQLSGGQKQRVAIARALIRNPKVLLFDEATSALDTENERIVQEALDIAAEGRTCIIIAHRLSTIVNADQIAVINNGIIEESGSHSELIARQGKYSELYRLRDHSEKPS